MRENTKIDIEESVNFKIVVMVFDLCQYLNGKLFYHTIYPLLSIKVKYIM